MNLKPYIATLEGQKIWRNQLIPQRNKALADMLLLAAKRMGQNSIDADVYKIAQIDMQNAVNDRLHYFSMEEIEELLRLGATGELNAKDAKTQNNGHFSAKNILDWVRVYLSDYRPKLAAIHREQAPQLPPAEVRKELTEDDIDDYLRDMREHFTETGQTFSFTYDLLRRRRGLELSVSERDLIAAEARVRLEERQKNKLASGRIGMADYLRSLETNPSDEFTAECKRVTVRKYFEEKLLFCQREAKKQIKTQP